MSDPSTDLADQIERIYVSSFPPAEREDFSTLLNEVRDGISGLLVAEALKQVLGFATMRLLSCQAAYFLGYLAVSDASRGQGLGSSLFQHLVQAARSNRNADGILFEVEPPEDASAQERLIREQRIRFYRKHGAEIVEGSETYRMPNLAGEGSIPMLLMWLPLFAESDPIQSHDIRSLITCIYADIYGRRADDRLLVDILMGLSD